MAISSTPVIAKERIEILDIIRGFALLGVMMDNLFGFSGWGFLTDEARQSLATWPADAIIGLLEQVFINGKFYSLFSMLFGVGFAIILTRHQQKGTRAIPVFYRRLLILALIGILFYYGIGLGIGGHIGPAVFIPIGLVVYLFQIAYSTWWLKHFQFGPLEWIWRQLTYGKRLPLRKETGEA